MATSEWALPPQFENGIMLEDLLSTHLGGSIGVLAGTEIHPRRALDCAASKVGCGANLRIHGSPE
jgi:hypothetical protein